MIEVNKEIQSAFDDLFDPSKWKTFRTPIDPFIQYLMDEDKKYHEALKKFYPDYEDRNERNPFDWAWERKRGRPSNAILMGRIFNELWNSDKVKRFGINPFQEYDDLHKKLKTEGRTLVVKYDQPISL